MGLKSQQDIKDAIANREQSLEIDPGTYYLQGLNILKQGTEMYSSDPENRAKLILIPRAYEGIFETVNRSGILLQDLILDGNFSNQPGAVRGHSALLLGEFKNCSEIVADGCTFRNGASDGLNFRGCDGITVTNCDCADLGHDTIYMIDKCTDALIQNNKFICRTNSCTRVGYGGTNIKILDNDFSSLIKAGYTGPLIQLDKKWFDDVVIKNNKLSNNNGSGIWLCGDQAQCGDVTIEDNIFDKVGYFYNGKVKYNGYSNGYICGMGFDEVVIKNNVMKNCLKYGIVMDESTHQIKDSYNWNFLNNTMEAPVGFMIESNSGSIVGSGNTIKVGKLCEGATLALKITSTPVDNTEPTIPSMEELAKMITHTAIVNGKKGELLHKTYKDATITEQQITDGQSLPYEFKVLIDSIYYGEVKGNVIVKKR